MQQLRLGETQSPAWERFELPDADVRLLRNFFAHREAEELLAEIRDGVRWRQDKIRFYGKEHDLPRLQQWHGDPGLVYTWSGIRMVPEPWLPVLERVRTRVEQLSGATFNTVLLNRYRDGNDCVSWHADDERSLGMNPTICSISLGAEREFLMRHNHDVAFKNVSIVLPPGSVLVMQGRTQEFWKHALPRRKNVSSERINLTFRRMDPTAQ